MNTVREIKSAIISNYFTNDELNEIAQAVVFARTQLAKDNKSKFVVGNQVKFKGRRGNMEVGVIVKLKIKNASVRVGLTNWNVPVNMLEEV